MTKNYFLLTDRQWQAMEKFLSVKRKGQYALHDLIDTIFWIFRTGSQWRNLPRNFPKCKSVYYHFHKWVKTERWLYEMLCSIKYRKNIKVKNRSRVFFLLTAKVKSGQFTKLEKGVDGNKKINGRERHIITGADLGRKSSSGSSGRWIRNKGCC